MNYILDQMPPELHDVVGPIRQVDVPGQGATSDVVVLSGAHGRFVVKRATKPPFHEWLRREYEVLYSLSTSSICIPKPLQYVENSQEGNYAHWLLMEYLPGVPLREHLRNGVDSAERHK